MNNKINKMHNRLITLVILFLVCVCNGQLKGVTETGDEVILYENGTWKYSNDSLNAVVPITKNEKLFVKDEKSNFLIKSKNTNLGIWINPKEWTFSKPGDSSPKEFSFENKGKDLYGLLLTEKIKIPIETLIKVAYNNAIEAAPDLKIIEKESRNVNGLDVIMMKMSGTIQGITFIYYGYYFTNTKGSYQFLTYTSNDLFEVYETEMVRLLNGITEY